MVEASEDSHSNSNTCMYHHDIWTLIANNGPNNKSSFQSDFASLIDCHLINLEYTDISKQRPGSSCNIVCEIQIVSCLKCKQQQSTVQVSMNSLTVKLLSSLSQQLVGSNPVADTSIFSSRQDSRSTKTQDLGSKSVRVRVGSITRETGLIFLIF